MFTVFPSSAGSKYSQEQALDNELKHYKSKAFANSTRTTYKSQLRAYLRFRLYFGYKLIPCSTQTLLRYVTFLSRTLSPNSIPNYLNVVRLVHLQYGYPNPLENELVKFQYSLILRGIKRESDRTATRPKLPITPKVLREMHKQLNLAESLDATFWAACLVAFYSFFRKANLLPHSREKFDERLQLRRTDLHPFAWGVVMFVRWNKTIQFRQRTLLIPLPRVRDSPLCPLTALRNAYTLTSEAEPYGPAFMYRQGTTLQLLTYNKFINKLKLTLRTAGFDTDQYAGHSFRRGGATFAMRCGVPVELIKVQGDWKSNAYERYIDNSFKDRIKAVAIIAKELRE